MPRPKKRVLSKEEVMREASFTLSQRSKSGTLPEECGVDFERLSDIGYRRTSYDQGSHVARASQDSRMASDTKDLPV